MSKTLSIEFETAVRLLTEHFSPSDQNSRKPILFHDIRVGVYLYEQGYSHDIVLAGVLHDALEWSDLNEKILRDKFGDQVTNLVLANTKDDSIKDKMVKTNDLIQRCVNQGQDALIIKTADIIDSFKWYTKENNKNELDYCLRNVKAIIKFKPEDFNDKIFNELRKWL